MSFRIVFKIVFLIVTVFNFIAQIKADEKCGTQVAENQFPWLVGIEFAFPIARKIFCTGALITRTHVVTNNLELDTYGGPKLVRLGPSYTDGSADGSISILIEAVIPHPQHNPTSKSHNIALIKLREAAPYTDVIRPICLASADITRSTASDRDLYLVGLSYRMPHQKVYAHSDFLEKADCEDLRHLSVESMICANNAEDALPCLMPGGVLMIKRGNIYELVGLLELRHCSSTKIFTDLYFYADWIRSKIPELSLEYSNLPKPSSVVHHTFLSDGCGKRKVDHVELIDHGEVTKPGDWPWHVAIYKLKGSNLRYICGGTLISKTMVLTAAHCATENGVPVTPEILSVILGKYNLIGGDLQSQERQVQSIIAHEDFAPINHLENDIAILKLRTEAKYNNYVQPACIWSNKAYDRLPSDRIFGTVVGWGFDHLDALSPHLNRANMPKVSDLTCIKKNPVFYASALDNEKKFCAGWANGTSACNGDSGGGFLVFIPDTAKDSSSEAIGSWYIRGIVSLSVALRDKARCDPYQYVVFTDIDKYGDWIQRHLIT